ncbi:hypothetical protein AB0K92_15880 [Streptomyces sp. NPDC052687]|uniref:hypothetical protein n=1 Tax=Streptomyces sp. NPDC052687 TaxID=3154759 RepID=UPI003432816C
MSVDTVPVWVIAVFVLLLIVFVVVAGAVVALRITVRGTSEVARPDIIRAVGAMFRDLFDALFRWRRK